MSAGTTQMPTIPRAQAPIDDRTLTAFARVAEKAQVADRLEDAEAALLIQNAAAIAHELFQRRYAADMIRDLTDPAKVVFLPAAQ